MTTSTTERYVAWAVAIDAWYCRLQVPLDTYDEVCGKLETASRLRNMPITAVVRGSAGDVTEIVLLRDPSVLFGTPPVSRYEDLVDLLTAATGWRRRSPEPLPGIVIPLGLRRGYHPDAPVHPARTTLHRLVDDVPGTRAWAVRLCSVRILHDGDVQWHHEPCLLVHANAADRIPGLARFAAELGQQRFVVTGNDMTAACKVRAPAGSAA